MARCCCDGPAWILAPYGPSVMRSFSGTAALWSSRFASLLSSPYRAKSSPACCSGSAEAPPVVLLWHGGLALRDPLRKRLASPVTVPNGAEQARQLLPVADVLAEQRQHRIAVPAIVLVPVLGDEQSRLAEMQRRETLSLD